MSKKQSTKQMKTRRAKKTIVKGDTFEASSGNVFDDLGLPDADELLIKANLAITITELIEQKGWTQTETARRIGIDQSKRSNLLRGRLIGLSGDRLLAILNRLGHSVEIRICAKESAPEQTRTHVTMA